MNTALDALGVRLPAPGWSVLDAVRERRFTGELTLIGSPPVRVWADRGRIYRAEAFDAPPLAARLVAAGVMTVGDLAAGVVRVSGREHLGALFERAPAADRNSITLAVAAMTEDALRDVASQHLAAAEIIPYAFDPAGVHLWTPGGPPAAAVDQRDHDGQLAAPPPDAVPAAGPEVPTPPDTIDWDQLSYLDGPTNGDGHQPDRPRQPVDGFAVIWPDGDVERRRDGSAVTTPPSSPVDGVSAAARGRLLEERFGPVS